MSYTRGEVNSVAKHSVALVVGTGLTAALSLAYSVCAGRTLGPSAYADFTAALSLVFFCNIAMGPINETVTRFTAVYQSRGELGKVRTLSRKVAARTAWVALPCVIAALMLIGPLTIALKFNSRLPLLVVVGIVCLTLPLCVARGVLRGVQRFGQYNVNIIVEAAIRLAVGVALLALICNAAAGLLAYILGLAAILVVSRIQLRHVWSGHPAEPIDGGPVRRFTIPIFIMMLTFAGFQNIDMPLVKHYFSPADAGLYGAAFTLARAISVLLTPFSTLLLPLLTTMHERGHRVAGAFARLCVYFLALAAGPVIAFWLWPDRITVGLFGPEFAGAGALLLAVTAARLVGSLCHLIALAGASTNNFRFLYVYVPGLALQLLAVTFWHGTTLRVVVAVLAAQCVTLIALVLLWAGRAHSRQRKHDAGGNDTEQPFTPGDSFTAENAAT